MKVALKAPDAAPASESQVSQYRALLGALGWLMSQTRPDLAAQCSLAQQAMPTTTVLDLKRANQVLRRARRHDGLKIRILPIPVSEVRFALGR